MPSPRRRPRVQPPSPTYVPPPPSSPHSSPVLSDDEHQSLSGSYLLVSSEDEREGTASSTLGSSIHGSVIDLLSDTSSEPSHDNHHDTQWEDDLRDITHLSGSYVDAEASTTELSTSESTIPNPYGLDSTSSSQMRLIMPDPTASYSSSGNGTTPNASLGNLLNLPELLRRGSTMGGGVDRSWLEASSRLWNVSPEMERLVRDGEGLTGYAALGSMEIDNQVPVFGGASNTVKMSETVESVEQEKIEEERQELRRAVLNGLRNISKNWSVSASVVALTILSAALFQSFHPTNINLDDTGKSSLASRFDTLAGKTASIWDTLSSTAFTSTASSEASAQAVIPPQVPVPDLQLIRQALSTFTTTSRKDIIPDTIITTSADSAIDINVEVRETKRRRLDGATSSTALAVRQSTDVGFTLPSPYPASSTSIVAECVECAGSVVAHRSIAPRTMNSHRNLTCYEAKPAYDTHPNRQYEPCDCGPASHARNEMLHHVLSSIRPARRYAISASRYLDHVFTPAYIELQKELGELVALGKTFVETSSTMSQFIIHRAARGLFVSRHALNRFKDRLQKYIPIPVVGDHSVRNDLAKARASIDSLQEYVEAHTMALGEYVEEQAALVQEKGMESLKQARRGLDRLIAEARRAVDGVDGDVGSGDLKEWDGEGMGKKRSYAYTGIDRFQARRDSTKRRRMRKEMEKAGTSRRVHPRAERSSKGRKLWDALHHGAFALVI